MVRTIKALKIKEEDRTAEWIQIKDDLEEYYKELDCNTIAMITLKQVSNSHRVVLIVDDDGKEKERAVTLYLHRCGRLLDYVVGDVLAVRVNCLGQVCSLKAEDYEIVKPYMF